MNREIEFRGFHQYENGEETIYINGQAIKGKWVYGLLCWDLAGNLCIQDDCGESGDCYVVILKTIGQYTDSKDKNGKKIFEGDIAKIREINQEYKGAIKFGEFNYSHCDEYSCTHFGWFVDCQNANYCFNTGMDLYAFIDECEVIGTIFDKVG